MRGVFAVFAAYLILISAGIVLYTIVGFTQH
jgi:hypothetical protein